MRRGSAKDRHKPQSISIGQVQKTTSYNLAWARNPRNPRNQKNSALVPAAAGEDEQEPQQDEQEPQQDEQDDDPDTTDPDTTKPQQQSDPEHNSSGGFDDAAAVLDSPQGKEAVKYMRMEASILVHEWASRGQVTTCVHTAAVHTAAVLTAAGNARVLTAAAAAAAAAAAGNAAARCCCAHCMCCILNCYS